MATGNRHFLTRVALVAGALAALGLLTCCANGAIASPTSSPLPTSDPARPTLTPVPTNTIDRPLQETQTAIARGTNIANVYQNATASVVANATLLASMPSQTPMPPTATLDYASFADTWHIFQDDTVGYRYEYPAIFDQSAYRSSGCGVNSPYGGISVEYLGMVDTDLGQFGFEQIDPDRSPALTATGFERGMEYAAFSFQYTRIRFGLMHLFRLNSKVMYMSYISTIHCDVPELELTEFDAYQHMLKTFEFLQ